MMNSPQAAQTTAETPFVSLAGGLSEESKLELLEYWRSITKRKLAIFSLGLFVAIVAAAIVYSLQPVYSSTVTVLIEQSKNKVLSFDEVYGGISQDKEHYQTQVEIIKSREVGMRVVKLLRLWEYPEFDPRKDSDSWVNTLFQSIGIRSAPPKWNDESLANAAFYRFSKNISVEPVRLSQLVKVSFESRDKTLAASVANTIANAYIDLDREARFKMTQQANEWLQDRTKMLRDKLAMSEQALQSFRDKQGIVSLSGSVQTIIGQQIGDVAQRLAEAKSRRAEAESAFNQVKSIKDGDYTTVPAVIRNPAVADAKRQESTAALKVAELQQRYGSEHPKMVQAMSELKAARENLNRQMQAVVSSLTHEYETARSTEKALDNALNAARGTIQNVNRQEFELGVLDREVQSNKQLYDMFMSRAKETNVGNDLQSSVARIVDPAVVANNPVKPKKQQIIVIAMILGLFAGVMISLLLDKLDNTINGTEDAERRLSQPVLSALPELSDEEAKNAITAFIDSPDSQLAESIRTARTGVLLSDIDLTHRVLLITSSMPGEGKTTVSTNLAMAHAQTRKTLLIDLDMRRPQIGKRLGMPLSAKGISSLVSGASALGECIYTMPGSTLSVMPAGDLPPNPLELLLSQKFKETLAWLRDQYEVIIIDSPPVELVSDALVIAPMVNRVVFVVRAMKTPYPLARKGILRVQRSGGRMLGVVLNHLDFKKSQRYYGSYSGYGIDDYESYGYGSKKSEA
ncbi:GumC family protein [Uliginosibacterium sediminicola]|uniref:non-specific protein-tyrosine kinase n=1 Tax=Uliginosibacterium sediminicola TaxID=2024550 RepID=A0ABU9Z087_9RHOO